MQFNLYNEWYKVLTRSGRTEGAWQEDFGVELTSVFGHPKILASKNQ